ncbi:MAG: hypothetical protein ACRDY1_11000 [Acidimicrobiales bacterium]
MAVTGSVWADAAGQLVQGNIDVAGTGQKAAGLTASVDLSGYGAPVTITVPPSSEVRPIPASLVADVFGKLLRHARRL